MHHQALERILHALQPAQLHQLLQPHDHARETYTPQDQHPTTSATLHTELTRYLTHHNQHQYQARIHWPQELASQETDRLLHQTYGPQPTRPALKTIHQHGLRHLLDTVTQQLKHNTLHAHLTTTVLLHVQQLSPHDRYQLTHTYLTHYPQPHTDLEHTSIAMNDWPRLLHEHANLVLHHR